MLSRNAQNSQKKEYPDDWVWSAERNIEGINLKMEYTECGVLKFYKQQSVEELGHYCNFADVIMSIYLNLGLNVDKTLGQGHDQCIFKYRLGKDTNIPPNLYNYFK